MKTLKIHIVAFYIALVSIMIVFTILFSSFLISLRGSSNWSNESLYVISFAITSGIGCVTLMNVLKENRRKRS